MSEPTIDEGLLADLVRELRCSDGNVCYAPIKLDNRWHFCTRKDGHGGPCAHACSKGDCTPVVFDGNVAELLASLYAGDEVDHCNTAWSDFVCTRPAGVPHSIHVAHHGHAVCLYGDRYAVWRKDESEPGCRPCSNVSPGGRRCAWADGHSGACCWIPGRGESDTGPFKAPAIKPLSIDVGLRLAADSAFRFFAGLHLQDQPIAVQREARDVLQALGRALRGTGADR